MGVKLRCEPSGLQILVTLCHNSLWPKFRFFMLKTGLKTFLCHIYRINNSCTCIIDEIKLRGETVDKVLAKPCILPLFSSTCLINAIKHEHSCMIRNYNNKGQNGQLMSFFLCCLY